jgi:cyclopentanol dehydrogenase
MTIGRIQGKIAIITGGARGLGAAAVTRFCEEGGIVHLADIDAPTGEAFAARLRDSGYQAEFHHLDVTSESAWQAVLGAVDAQHGRIDILVNNAGVALPIMPIDERPLADWQLVMDVNAKGVFLGTKYVLPIMKRNGGGAIVNLSSAAALGQWQTMEGVYAASKAAVHVFTKSVGTQYAEDNIRCNSVHPGPIDGEMAQAILGANPDILARRLTRVPMKRLGQPGEVAAAILFLASDEASYITGAQLSVDGGAVAQ